MAPTVEILPIPALKLGEGPHWDIASQSLYLVDIIDSILIRYDLKANKSFLVKLEIPQASFIIPVEGCRGKFVIGSGINLYLVKWDGSSDKVESADLLHKLSNDLDVNRINDGKCDPTGRLWFGTMNIEESMTLKTGKLYSFSKEEGCREFDSGIGISNGLGWEGNAMYYIDSMTRAVSRFDYNRNGDIKNRRVLFDLKKNNMDCLPDGMTLDKDGKLWVACFFGSQVLKVDPKTGELLEKVAIPTSQVTSVAWGGPNLEDLFVTSANIETISSPKPGQEQNAGCTFRVSGLSTSGLPMIPFKL